MNFQLIFSFLITIIIIPNRVLGQQNNVYCYGSDKERPQTNHFATKTTYERSKGGDFEYSKNFKTPECKVEKLWFISRHGTRLPPANFIRKFPELESIRERIVQNIDRKNSRLCDIDGHLFKTWKLNKTITEDYASFLTNKAKQDIRLMAKRNQKLLIDILPNQYSPEHYLFRHTNTERTESSFRAFAEGLFGKSQADAIVLPKPPKIDKLLEPYEMCEDYKKNDESLEKPDSEVSKFKNSDIMKQTVQEVSDRLGFIGGLELNEVELMWDMCRYEEAWHSYKSSAWCAAFTEENVNVLEYAEDLKYYYKNGYGYDKNSQIACSALKDMINHLKDSNTDPRAILYFGHSAIIQLLLNAMGFKKDTVPLTSTNYSNMKYRQWKTSLISPFTANFAAVKYACPDEPKVMFFLNQIPVTDLNWCAVGLCRWNDVIINYDTILNHDCDEYFCYGSNSSTIKLSLSLLLISCIYFVTLYF